MIFVIDIGNTNITCGIVKNHEIVKMFNLSTRLERTIDEYEICFYDLFKLNNIEKTKIKDIVVANVVPNIMSEFESAILNFFGKKALIIGRDIKPKLVNHYDNPSQLGMDRVVNAIAAYEKYRGPIIIVDFGTATTFCYVNKNGEFCGGLIMPGIKTSINGLKNATSKLPDFNLNKGEKIVCTNTVDSLEIGMFLSVVGSTDFIISKIIEEQNLDSKKINVVATGGLSQLIAGESIYNTIINKNLTLEGLSLIYEKNK